MTGRPRTSARTAATLGPKLSWIWSMTAPEAVEFRRQLVTGEFGGEFTAAAEEEAGQDETAG
ncbi:hypothetical protein AB0A05_27045 [Streptomyces sp. NPDC046374]|uniref:hypothetical protein n=1 Tax=Streptomyces sp. NPDC046374 TaxID=3154917 RepID=UPI00340A216C